MYVSSIEIYETFTAGSVASVALWSGDKGEGKDSPRGGKAEDGGWDVVWKADEKDLAFGQLAPEARLFAPPIAQRGYATQYVRIELVTKAAPKAGDKAGGDATYDPPLPGSGTYDPPLPGSTAGGEGNPQIDAIRVVGMRAPEDAAATEAPPLPAGGNAGGPAKPFPGGDGEAGKQGDKDRPRPGSRAVASNSGPKFRQAEAQLAQVKEGHAREMTQLRTYVGQLRAYGEAMRAELDRTKAELHVARGAGKGK